MEAFLIEHNLYGLCLGAFTFLVIGLFHPLVVKAEYYWGKQSWWCFLLLGVVCVFLSIFMSDLLWSSVLGVTAFSSFWSILEVFEQEKRVEKGWFPHNPKKKAPRKTGKK